MNNTNPLLQNTRLPLFEMISPDHAEPAIMQLIENAEASLAALEKTVRPSWEDCMAPLFALTEPMDFAWGIISHLHSVMNTPEWRAAHETLLPRIVAFSSRLGQSESIYQAMRQLKQSPGWSTLGETKQRLIASAMNNAEQAGVGLPPEQRKRMLTLHDQLAGASTTFSNHLLDATKAYSLKLDTETDMAGLPLSLRQAACSAAIRAGHNDSTPEEGPWVMTLEAPLFIPFMQYSQRRDLRETLYRAYVTRASAGDTDNTALIIRILECRHEMATILGFESFAELILRTRMAQNVQAVDHLIESLRRAARPAAEREHADLLAFAQQRGQTGPLMNWDVSLWSEQMRKALFDFDDEDLRPYFQFPSVLSALFTLSHQLFDITIAAADGKTSVWHKDVRYFEVMNADGTTIASFYLDPYSRPETKRGGAWMNAARSRKRLADGSLVPPAAYLVCNQTLPTREHPSLMTLNEVATLFHEFGHALHHLLTTVEIPAASGIHNVEWDAVELPSQFMENWCYHKPVLLQMARHITTGETLPSSKIDQIRQSRTFRAGSATLRQLLFGAIDMELHARYRPSETISPNQVKEKVAALYAILPTLPEDRFLCGFSHIFSGGYAAAYYSYKWAEVLSADVFAAFEEAGLEEPHAITLVGNHLRDTILAFGGSRHPMKLFKDFRGREPDPEALLRHQGLLPAKTPSQQC